MRVFELNMTNSSHLCPSGLSNRQHACGWGTDASGCSSVMISTSNIRYTSVCGRVIAYQEGTPAAFNYSLPIYSSYVDGVSLTHVSPKEVQHIWTFATAFDEDMLQNSCPCIRSGVTDGANYRVPSFVGDDYFCEAASHQWPGSTCRYSDDLWDGAGCGNSTCCSFNNPPWFYKQLPQPTTDDIDMRLCISSNIFSCGFEYVAINVADIYVR